MSFNCETNMYEGYIYKIYNDIDSRLYIGLTTMTLKQRFYSHKNETFHKRERQGKSILYPTMRKYGFENFHIEEIEKIITNTKEELIQKLNNAERYYIKKYNTLFPNGLNFSEGGGLEGNCGKKNPYACYDLDGNFIKVYESSLSVYTSTGISLDDEILKKYRIMGGYIWIKLKDKEIYPQSVTPYEGGIKTRRICQVDLEGNIINTFNSIGEASKKTGINNVTIGDCVNNNRNGRLTAGGYRWYQIPFGINVNELHFEKYIPHINYNTNGNHKVPINMYSINDEYIMTFESAVSAGKYVNKNNSNINNCCRYRQKSAGGYHFYYADDINQPDKSKIYKLKGDD